MDFKEFAILNARGKMIQIPVSVAKLSPVLEKWVTGDWKDSRTSYFLNYSSEVIHLLLDHISVAPVKKTFALQAIMSELLIPESKYPFYMKVEKLMFVQSTGITDSHLERTTKYTNEGYKCGPIAMGKDGIVQIMIKEFPQ